MHTKTIEEAIRVDETYRDSYCIDTITLERGTCNILLEDHRAIQRWGLAKLGYEQQHSRAPNYH